MIFSNFISAISGDYILLIGLGVVLILVIFVLPMFTNRRRQKQVEKMQETVVVGAEIKTVGGIIGTIIEVRDKSPVDKEIVIETGIGDSKCTMVLDMQAVYQVLHTVAALPPVEPEQKADEAEAPSSAAETSAATDLFAPVNLSTESSAEAGTDDVAAQTTLAETSAPLAETSVPTGEAEPEKTETAAAESLETQEENADKAAVTPSANSSKKTAAKKGGSSKSSSKKK